MQLQEAKNVLANYHQEHLLRYYDELDAEGQAALLEDISSIDFSTLDRDREPTDTMGEIRPLKAMELPEIAARREEFRQKGLMAIREGKVAAVLLAGGMGTRLGASVPKGMFDIGLTKPVYIFQRLFENMLDVVRAAGTFFPVFIMTSEKNHDQSVAFLKEKNFFGYDPTYIDFFRQEKAPATDYNGKVYLEGKNRIATSPNGNGGWFSSMIRTGSYDRLTSDDPKFNRVEWLNAFGVDNVLQRIADPVFLGATMDAGCACGAKVVRKAAPDEKVGVMCQNNGHPCIVEYYELTEEMKNTLDKRGEPAYNFGVIFNYLFRLQDLKAIAGTHMPLHRVEKKIPYMDASGQRVTPEKPNGYKYETLALDMIRLLDTCLPFEVVRAREFAPVKNATGVDSVESARALCQENGISL